MTECILCEEAITNPICPACLQEGVQQWLFEQGEEKLVDEVNEVTRGVFANNGDTYCIKCDSSMALCAYCYTQSIFNIIKEHPKLLRQYVEYFNYDLGHMGWEQDAELYLDH
jgi:hypothetical protein